jgi:propanediol dehydratase large subunit
MKELLKLSELKLSNEQLRNVKFIFELSLVNIKICNIINPLDYKPGYQILTEMIIEYLGKDMPDLNLIDQLIERYRMELDYLDELHRKK